MYQIKKHRLCKPDCVNLCIKCSNLNNVVKPDIFSDFFIERK